MKCTKAIITVAGHGTRRLPITKAIEKSMLPIGNRPVIDFIVDDCLAAGITDFILVVGEQSSQLRNYYGRNEYLESYLAGAGKTDMLADVQALATKATFSFVVQDRTQPYGTSVPLWLTKDYVTPGESFLVMYGDNILYNQDGSSAVARFVEQSKEANVAAAMMAVEVPRELVSRYGILDTEQRDNLEIYKRIVEKPTPEEAPSNLNNAGCFILDTDIFPYLLRSIEHSPQEERYVIDALNWYSEDGNDIAVFRTAAEFLDCGNVDGWLHANNRILGSK